MFPFDWRDPRYGSRATVNDFTAVVLHTGGASLAQHRGGVHPVEAGCVHVVPAGEEHQVPDFGRAGGLVWAFLPAIVAADRALAHRVRGVGPVVRPVAGAFAELVDLANRAKEETRRAEWGAETVAEAALRLSLVSIVRAASGVATPPSSEPVQRALAWIEASYARPISLRDVARAVELSPRHLATRVRAESGRSVGEWLAVFCIARARELLRHTDRPVDDIAVEVGWGDTTHFIRRFRALERCTPSAWRRQLRTPATAAAAAARRS